MNIVLPAEYWPWLIFLSILIVLSNSLVNILRLKDKEIQYGGGL